MISRVRIDSYGHSPGAAASALHECANRLMAYLPNCSYGEEVIERDLNEPDDSIYVWKGRLNLHPDINGSP